MSRATVHRSLDPRWAHLAPLRVGAVPPGAGTPDRFVIVEGNEGTLLLRLDLHKQWGNVYGFEEALVWGDLLVVGLEDWVHVVRLDSRAVTLIDLGTYFGHFYPGDDYLLIASARQLFRLATDGTAAWVSDWLGIDGVIVHHVKDGVIEGSGEWDPPGGWRPFRLRLGSGEPC
jgi:hypothetical protein